LIVAGLWNGELASIVRTKERALVLNWLPHKTHLAHTMKQRRTVLLFPLGAVLKIKRIKPGLNGVDVLEMLNCIRDLLENIGGSRLRLLS
jgi:hypothetical protein